jgi:hypothetical protein
LALFALCCGLSAFAGEEGGELSLPGMTIYTTGQLSALRQRVATDTNAAAALAEIRAEADAALKLTPQALEKIEYEGLLPTDKRRQECVRRLADMRAIVLLLQAWAGSGDEHYAAAARRFILAWSAAYKPTGNPINENKLEPVLLGYFALRDGFTAEQRRSIEAWTRKLADAEAKRPTESHNWGAKRMKLLAWCAFILDDDKLLKRVTGDIERYISTGLFPDGTSEDLKRRDAMSYHVSGLEPFLQMTTALRRLRPELPDYYRWKSPTGSSLAGSCEFVLPYARGEQVYQQWRNTAARIDRDRAAAGIAEYRPGTPFPPEQALSLIEWMIFYDPSLVTLATKLNGGKPSWFWLELDCAR